jgi:hypothetical protein
MLSCNRKKENAQKGRAKPELVSLVNQETADIEIVVGLHRIGNPDNVLMQCIFSLRSFFGGGGYAWVGFVSWRRNQGPLTIRIVCPTR